MGFWDFFKGGSGKGSFLSPLTAAEKVEVSGLTPLLYMAVIQEKRGEAAPAIIAGPGTIDLEILKKLSIEDLETLKEAIDVVQEADSRSQSGDDAGAAAKYKEAIDINPYDDIATMSYGVCLAHQGRLREGVKWVEKAARLNPGSDRIRGNLAAMKANM